MVREQCPVETHERLSTRFGIQDSCLPHRALLRLPPEPAPILIENPAIARSRVLSSVQEDSTLMITAVQIILNDPEVGSMQEGSIIGQKIINRGDIWSANVRANVHIRVRPKPREPIPLHKYI